MTKLLFVVVLSLFYDVQITVFPKERVKNETVQDVQGSIPPELHQGRGSDPQEKPELQPDARWNPPVDALP